MKMYVCEKCGFVEHTRIVERIEVLPVRGEDVSYDSRVRMCSSCGEELFDEELDSVNLQNAYDVYRQRHNIITTEEIRALRLEYGFTQRGLSNLLGWGEISIHRYENGSVPDDAHNQLLRMIQDPWNMQKIFDKNRGRLGLATQRKVDERIKAIINQETPGKVDELLSSRYQQPSLMTGFKALDSDVLMEMMVFFAKQNGVYKTKLNKLLWYADFVHFRSCSVSVSGATYIHLPHGPVADGYDNYINRLLMDGSLTIREEVFGDFTAEKLLSQREADNSVFDVESQRTLLNVANYFDSWTATRIRNQSHEEAGYKETEELQPIPYSYAGELKVPI